jgi:hypothetical protein
MYGPVQSKAWVHPSKNDRDIGNHPSPIDRVRSGCTKALRYYSWKVMPSTIGGARFMGGCGIGKGLPLLIRIFWIQTRGESSMICLRRHVIG